MPRTLLIDDDADHAEALGYLLAGRRLTVVRAVGVEEAMRTLRNRALKCDFVIFVIADRTQPWLKMLHRLQQAGAEATLLNAPLFLCVSRVDSGLEFQVRIERMGARYVSEG
jgi:ActR/RegA family two-component response regulator